MRAACVLLQFLIIVAVLRSAPAPSPDEARVLGQLRKLVQDGDWKKAHDAARQFEAAVRAGRAKRNEAVEWPSLLSWLETAANYPDNRAHQKKARAKVAERLGLFDIALEQYDLQRKLGDDPGSDAAFCAYRGATQATTAGKLDRAVGFLDRMAELGITWVKEAGQKKAELVRRLAKAPEDVAIRMEFARLFWVENVPALGADHEAGRQFLRDTLRLKTTEGQRRQLYTLIHQWSLALDDPATAMEYARLLAKEFGEGPGNDAVQAVARHQLAQGRYDQARDRLLPLAGAGRDPRWALPARLALADAYFGLRQEAEAVKQLEAVANSSAEAWAVQDAVYRLAQHHMQRGDHTRAFHFYTRWQPRSDCKTCLLGMREDRQRNLALCLVQLKKHEEAARLCLVSLEDQRYSPSIALLLFRLYREAGQTDDLLAKVRKAPKLREHDIVKELVRIHALELKKNVAALIELAQDSSWTNTDTARETFSDWRCRAAAEALAVCLADVALVRQAVLEPKKNVSWLLYSLGRSSLPSALDVLAEAARKEKSYNCGNIAYALAMKGEAGRKILEKFSKEDTNGMAAASKLWLEKLAKNDSDLSHLPRPKPGSLPR